MFPATWGPRIFPGKTAPACCASLGGFGFFEVIYWEDLHLTIQWWKHVFCWIGFLVSCFVFPCFVHEAQGVPVNVLGHQPIDASKWMDCSSAGDQETTQANSLRMGLGYATYGVPIEWHHWHSYSSYTRSEQQGFWCFWIRGPVCLTEKLTWIQMNTNDTIWVQSIYSQTECVLIWCYVYRNKPITRLFEKDANNKPV